jgi:hypothetical protein
VKNIGRAALGKETVQRQSPWAGLQRHAGSLPSGPQFFRRHQTTGCVGA